MAALTVALQPKSIYGVAKLMAENLCELAHSKHRLPIVVSSSLAHKDA
jgi:nucleoside-diphosphate-sugar epimerase